MIDRIISIRLNFRHFQWFVLFVFVVNSRATDGQLSATIEYQYFSSSSNYTNVTRKLETSGLISTHGSDKTVLYGRAFVLVDKYKNYDACQTPINSDNISRGVAIIHRGGDCTYSTKITRAKQFGATAVIIYDPQSSDQSLLNMVHNQSDMFSVYVSRTTGANLFDLTQNSRAQLRISLTSTDFDENINGIPSQWFGNRSATIFIVVAISVLVSICTLWFVFYTCQRYRSRTAKDRLQRRLNSAAKKTLSKITLVTIKDPSVVSESCVICLDTMKVGDVARQLVCHHSFHQSCVDPWLLSHRHCPLCNLDILTAYRVSVSARSRRCSVAPETNQLSIIISTVSSTISDDQTHVNQ